MKKPVKFLQFQRGIGSYVYSGDVLVREDSSELLSQLKKLRPISIQQAELDKQKTILANNYSSIANILNDSYTKADDAVRNQVDAMFSER